MTIQPPPNDDLPPTSPTDEPTDTPIDTPNDPGTETAPEIRAPGADGPPLGAPRDEPDPGM
jgi:hypothetical protein